MSIEEYRAVMAQAAQPLKERLTEIDTTLTELRAEKTEIESILRKTDQLPSKNGKKKTTTPSQVNPETLDRFFGALERLDVGTLFYASMLEDDTRFNFISRSHITKALHTLHDDGRITLHSTGIGGRKLYTVVR